MNTASMTIYTVARSAHALFYVYVYISIPRVSISGLCFAGFILVTGMFIRSNQVNKCWLITYISVTTLKL